jgi:hypothetical protein
MKGVFFMTLGHLTGSGTIAGPWAAPLDLALGEGGLRCLPAARPGMVRQEDARPLKRIAHPAAIARNAAMTSTSAMTPSLGMKRAVTTNARRPSIRGGT